MPRFFVLPSAIQGKRFVLAGSEAHHALRVLRKKKGDEIELFDGKDAAFRGRIESIAGQEIRGSVVEDLQAVSLPVTIVLYQALTRGPKWEWMLEKSCEIGAAKIIPLQTKRGLIKLDANQAREKLKRWNRIALAASKQCGRSHLMTVESPVSPAVAFSALDKQAISLIPWEKESKRSIRDAIQSAEREALPLDASRCVNIFIGPEGGWDAPEIDQAQAAGVVPVRLGPTLLRTETAGLVAATLVFREFGVY